MELHRFVKGNKMRHSYVGFMVAILCSMFATMGHYFEMWPLLYVASILIGIVVMFIFEGIGETK